LDGDAVDDFAVSAPVAYSSRGRTGSVLIFSGKSGSVLRRFDGKVPHLWFGGTLKRLPDLDGDGSCELAIGTGTRCCDRAETSTEIVSPRSGKELASLVGYRSCLGVFGDRDGDGSSDLLVVPLKGRQCEVVSGKDFRRLGEVPIPAVGARVIADFDGDGTLDHAEYSARAPARVTVRSGATGNAIREFALPLCGEGISIGDLCCLASDLDGDGEPDLVLNATDDGARHPSLLGLSGLDGSTKLALLLTDHHGDDGNIGQRFVTLLDAGDLDGDGAPDILVVSHIWNSMLAAYSTKTSRQLWFTGRFDMVGADAGINVMSDRNGDGVREVLHGSVEYILDGPFWGQNGRVEILSGKDGKELLVLPESKVRDWIGPERVR
jgi:hypothetical protein